MGYWNETCMLTGLPIQTGEDVVGYFIARRRVPDGKTYPNAFYAPVTTPIYGQYDGYGRMENVRPGTPADKLLQVAGVKTKHNGKYEDIIEPDVLACALRANTEHNLFIPDSGKLRTYCPAYLVMVRREFHDTAMTAMNSRGCMPVNERDTGAFSQVEPILRHAVQNKLLNYEHVRELVAFNRYLALMRRSWHPTTGAGSQDEIEWQFQTNFYEQLLETAKDMYLQANR